MHAFDLAFVAQPSAKSWRSPACDAKAAGYSCNRFERPAAARSQRVEPGFDRGGQRLCLRPPQSAGEEEFELESKGIPRRRLQHLAAACDISEELELLEDEPLEALRLECAFRELPFVVLRDRRELAICLLAIALWDALPHSELVREARHWGVPTSAVDTEGLIAHLVDALWTSLAEARGVPVRRLPVAVGIALVGKAARLEGCSAKRVEAEFGRMARRRHLPAEPGAGKQFYIELIVLMLVLEEASIEQLKQECREAGLAGSANVTGEAAQRELLQRRLLGAALSDRWEARGIPIARLGMESAIRVALRHEQLEAMGMPELSCEVQAMHLSQHDPAKLEDEKDLRERLKAAALWAELPVQHLQDECKEWGLLPASSDRGVLMEQLALAGALTPSQVALWEERGVPLRRLGSQRERLELVSRLQSLEQKDGQELREAYREASGLPPEAGAVPKEPEQLLQRLRQLLSWKALPLNELRKECHDAGISHRSVGVALSEEEKRGELVDRLVLSRWAEHWSGQYPVGRFGTIRSARTFVETMQRLVGREVGLQAELASVSGLPQEAFGTMTRQELVENIKKVLLWKELPLDDLQDECLQLSLSWRVGQEGISVQQQHQELLERLVMATCARAWEAQGLPVKRLGSAEAATSLRQRWQALEGLGVEELRREHAALGLPARTAAPKVLDLLPRLRQAALWESLPLGELQRECRQLGVEHGIGSRDQVLKALICGTWAPPDDANDASQDFWKSAASKEAAAGPRAASGPSRERLRKVAVHFQTLGLPPDAGLEELKRSYRKLILQHHPDKNQGAAQEEAARRFREVSEAYEAISEFMRMRH